MGGIMSEETREEKYKRVMKELEDEDKAASQQAGQRTSSVRDMPPPPKSNSQQPVGNAKPRSKYLMLAVQFGLVILIAVAVCHLMVPRIAPTLGDYDTLVANQNAKNTAQDSAIAAVNSSIPNTSLLATKAELNSYAKTTALSDYAKTSDLNSATDRITALEASLENQLPNNLNYSLSGTFGNYTLSVVTKEAGNFTARLSMLYNPAVNVGAVNATFEEAYSDFFVGGNWTPEQDENYTPVLSYACNCNQWKVSEVYFYISKFALGVDNSTEIDINFDGLKYTPSLAYAEVFTVV